MSETAESDATPEQRARTPFLLRMARAAMLHADTYEEVEADRSSLAQATLVVAMASTAAGLGFWLRVTQGRTLLFDSAPLAYQMAIIALEPMVIWIGASTFSFMVGATFFRGPETETDFAEVLRTTGFAFTPAILAVFAFLPPNSLGLGILAVSRVWCLVATVVAVRQALDFTTLRAIGTFGSAVALLWLVLWGVSVAPLPL